MVVLVRRGELLEKVIVTRGDKRISHEYFGGDRGKKTIETKFEKMRVTERGARP